MVDLAHGGLWDHYSSSTLEVAWNLLRANGTTEQAFSKLRLPNCPSFLLDLPAVHEKVRRRTALQRAFYQRILAGIPFPPLLEELNRLGRSGLPFESKVCHVCAASGVHCAAFDLPWVTSCPVHGVSLSKSADYHFNLVVSSGKGRAKLVRALDAWAKSVLKTLQHMKCGIRPFRPMSPEKVQIKKWHFDFIRAYNKNSKVVGKAYSSIFDGVTGACYKVEPSPQRSRECCEKLLIECFKSASNAIDDAVLSEIKCIRCSGKGSFDYRNSGYVESGLMDFLKRERRFISIGDTYALHRRSFPEWARPESDRFFVTTVDHCITPGVDVERLNKHAIDHLVSLKLYESLLWHISHRQPRQLVGHDGGKPFLSFIDECNASAFNGFYFLYRNVIVLPVYSLESVIALASNPPAEWFQQGWSWDAASYSFVRGPELIFEG